MIIIKNIGLICTISWFLSARSIYAKSFSEPRKNQQKKIVIENLSDGNYRFCSEPNPYLYEDEVDVHRYCFTFTKIGKRIVGNYLYRAPKDTPSICIEGVSNDNYVTGVGYESIGPSTQPYIEEDFSYLEELPSSNQLSYWDDVENYQGGLNLKVGNPSLYELSPAIEDGHGSYWATKRFEIVKLDLSNFEHIKLDNLVTITHCNKQ